MPIPRHMVESSLSEREKRFIREHPKATERMLWVATFILAAMFLGVLSLMGYTVYLMVTT